MDVSDIIGLIGQLGGSGVFLWLYLQERKDRKEAQVALAAIAEARVLDHKKFNETLHEDLDTGNEVINRNSESAHEEASALAALATGFGRLEIEVRDLRRGSRGGPK